MATLLEQYKPRLVIAEQVYAREHNGEKMSENRKLVVAQCLKNIDAFLNEAFSSSQGTQRADMGLWKKFCLNLTNVAVPNLIANELVMVSPMTSMSGYIAYIKYTAGTTKGATTQGDVFNSPFKLGDVDETYTSDRVVETFATGQTAVAWTPVAKGTFKDADGNVLGDIKVTDGTDIYYGTFAADAEATGTLAGMTFVDETGTTASYTIVADDKLAYVYNNIVVPQNNLPTLKAEMDGIALLAKARRIAVYFSQIAAFQAKTDYGIDLGDQLAEKAVGQLSYEIDTEVTQLLIDNATFESELQWSKTLPVGVSKMEHYQGFLEVVALANMIIYNRTKRFSANYMLCSSALLPVLGFINGWNAAPAGQINGPYFAGTLQNIKVFVTPNIAAGEFVVGVNGDDLMSSAAVYAPYMAIVPTQLLQFADGGTTQGWSTMYDLKMLNPLLLVKGKITA